MCLGNPVYPLPQGFFSAHINGDHKHVSRYKSYSSMETGLNRLESFSFVAITSPNISDVAKAGQDLLPPRQRNSCFQAIVIWYDYTRGSYITSIY